MGGKNTKDKKKDAIERKQEQPELEPPPLFVNLPHFNQDLWPTFKEALSASIKNGKQLDECITTILRKNNGIPDLELAFFETFDFNFDNRHFSNNNNNQEEKEKEVKEKGDEEKEKKKEEGEKEKEKKQEKTKEEMQAEQEQSTFFLKTLPFMQRLALEIETLFPAPTPSSSSSSTTSTSSSTSPPPSSPSPPSSPTSPSSPSSTFPTLTFGGKSELTLKQNEIVCLLAHCFFNTYTKMPHEYFQDPNFVRLYYPEQLEVVKFFIHYFNRMAAQEDLSSPVTYTRRAITKEQEIDWANCGEKLIKVEVHTDGTIEDSPADLHADFANRYIGGGVLRGGHVQEEILFCIKPECVAAMVFCARMEENEVIFITGAERFSKYAGYGLSLKFDGDYVDTTPRDAEKRLQRQILAMDASLAFATGGWHKEALDRDLHKAHCGFWIDNTNLKLDEYAIATGNWGCGAFGGDINLKFLQQLMAASVAKRKVFYYTFKESGLTDSFNEINDLLLAKNVTVGALYKMMVAYDWQHEGENIFAIIKRRLVHKAFKTDFP